MSFVDEGLGHASHLVDLGDGSALIVDPARFPTGQRAHAARAGLQLAFTADTHTHADYISGGPELAGDGATFLAPSDAALLHPHEPIGDGDEVTVGHYRLAAIATPGHTPDHLSYLLSDSSGPVALFSGGFLMVGTVGRPDLLGDQHSDRLARAMWAALQERILTLPDGLAVYPTHGAGSFCSAPSGAARTTTIGRERATSPLLQTRSEDEFVEQLLSGLGTFPDYFRRLPEVNRQGVARYDAPPALDRLDVATVEKLVAQGAAVVDVRPIRTFAAGHVEGSLSIELRPVFATWIGWLVGPDTPIIFVVDPGQDEVDLVAQCLTVGVENLAGILDGGADVWRAAGHDLATMPVGEATDAARHGTVIDVRQAGEFAAGHIPGAVSVELGNIAAADVPAGDLAIMCGHGERAMSAASLLARTGERDLTVLVGGPDDWARRHGALVTGG